MFVCETEIFCVSLDLGHTVVDKTLLTDDLSAQAENVVVFLSSHGGQWGKLCCCEDGSL